MKDAVEQTTFIYEDWPPPKNWVSQATANRFEDIYLANQARQHFWSSAELDIQARLDAMRQEGWSPAEAVNRDNIRLHKTEWVSRRPTFEDVVLWVMTLGIALIIQLLLDVEDRRFVSYEAGELRVEMLRDFEMLPAEVSL
jgi:hypothetical protein